MSTYVTCEWFALCTNVTAGGAQHPVLGIVPICDRCAARLGITQTHQIGSEVISG